MRQVVFPIMLVGALVGGCSHHGALRERAAFDFRCTQEQIEITPLPHRQAGVEGCGRRGVYVLTQSGWVLNSEEVSGPARQGAAPPPVSPAQPAQPQ